MWESAVRENIGIRARIWEDIRNNLENPELYIREFTRIVKILM